MTTQQHPAQFDWATELLDAEGHVTLSAKEAHEIGARLRSMGEKLNAYEDLDEAASDVQLLRMGYAAARLEIESLRARCVEPAGEYPALPEPFCNAHSDADSEWPDMFSESQMRAFADATYALRASHGQAPAQAAPAAVAGPKPGERCQHCIDLRDGFYGSYAPPCPYHDDDGKPRVAAPTAQPAPQPSPASQGDALDTVRLDWLDKNIFHREMSDWDAKYGHGSGYNMWVLFAPKGAQGSARSIIDAARAAQEGKSHDN